MSGPDRISVVLTPEQSVALSAIVEAGAFASVDDIVREALDAWQAKRLVHGYTPEEIAVLIAEGDASGDPVDGEMAFERIKHELEGYIAKQAS
ncbi:type II toxin-antitoxin system ParD family antitoxin [Rhizobium sp. FKL33]|uniref:ribbon-helix-helix domain-containing protein n=1 Tax=Rhizobium sp. FKL33 TaxID=2562307 RepID=UPI0010C09177|nr:type II toxin-antitoxin system ParD family antitoxin [Rhizobium sp. FKL33]